MDMIRVVLSVVVFDDERLSLNPVVMTLMQIGLTEPGEVDDL